MIARRPPWHEGDPLPRELERMLECEPDDDEGSPARGCLWAIGPSLVLWAVAVLLVLWACAS